MPFKRHDYKSIIGTVIGKYKVLCFGEPRRAPCGSVRPTLECCYLPTGEIIVKNASAVARGDDCRKAPNGSGYVEGDGYRRIYRNGVAYYEHRWVMEKHLGHELPKGATVHHKNGKRTDNRLCNLEIKIGNHGKGQSIRHLIEDLESMGCTVSMPKHLREVM